MTSPLTPSQQRLRGMEVLLRWEGALDNARLREVFGVQAVQASRLLSSFLAAHGADVTRASPHAPIAPTEDFAPRYAGPSPDEYLGLVTAASPRDVAPFMEDLRLDLAPISSATFSLAAQACRGARGLRIHYRSLANPSGEERLVFPHALVRAARRWHLRAWCVLRQDFRDFALGRISSASLEELAPPVEASSDKEWSSFSKLIVIAHPGLSSAQARLLQDEYLGGAVERTVTVRKALVSYTLQDLRLAVDVARQTPPEFQLALKNVRDFDGAFALRGSPEKQEKA
jgi:hypothetical protein